MSADRRGRRSLHLPVWFFVGAIQESPARGVQTTTGLMVMSLRILPPSRLRRATSLPEGGKGGSDRIVRVMADVVSAVPYKRNQ